MAWTTGVMHFSAITNKMDAACKEQMYSYNSLESNGKKIIIIIINNNGADWYQRML